MAAKKTRHYRNLRRRVWERDKGICQLCLDPIESIKFMTFDHIKPKSKGGGMTFENLRASHKSCNNIRGDKDVAVGYLALKKLTTDERIALQKQEDGQEVDYQDRERYAG